MGALSDLIKGKKTGATTVKSTKTTGLKGLLEQSKNRPVPRPIQPIPMKVEQTTTTGTTIGRIQPFLGGGSYNLVKGQPNTLVKSTPAYGLLPKTDKRQEGHHIVGVAQGGTSEIDNFKNLDPKDHARITAVQNQAMTEYRNGMISLPEARLRAYAELDKINLEKQGYSDKNINLGGKLGQFADKIMSKVKSILPQPQKQALPKPKTLMEEGISATSAPMIPQGITPQIKSTTPTTEFNRPSALETLVGGIRATSDIATLPITATANLLSKEKVPLKTLVDTTLEMAKEDIKTGGRASTGKAAQMYLQSRGVGKYGGNEVNLGDIAVLATIGLGDTMGDPIFYYGMVKPALNQLKFATQFKKTGQVSKALGKGVKITQPQKSIVSLSDDLKIVVDPKSNKVTFKGYVRRGAKGEIINQKAITGAIDDIANNAGKELTTKVVGNDIILSPKVKAIPSPKVVAQTPKIKPQNAQGEVLPTKTTKVSAEAKPSVIEPLEQEAKKYKTADEFIKNNYEKTYRAGSLDSKRGIFTTNIKKNADIYGSKDTKTNKLYIDKITNNQKASYPSSWSAYQDLFPDDNISLLLDFEKDLQKIPYFYKEGDKKVINTMIELNKKYKEKYGVKPFGSYDTRGMMYKIFSKMGVNKKFFERDDGGIQILQKYIDKSIYNKLKNDGIKLIEYTNPKEMGYIQEGIKTKEYQILDNSIIKTKSQLTEIWNKANKQTLPKPKKQPIKYVPVEKPVDLRKKITTERVVAKPSIPQRIKAESIKSGLEDAFGDIEYYNKVSVKGQAEETAKLINEDYDRAIRIAMGQENAPGDLLPESVLIGVKNQAIKTGDTELLINLATAEGGVARESTVLGQRIKMLDEGLEDDAFRNIKKVVSERRNNYQKKTGKSVDKAIKQETDKIKEAIKKAAPKADAWTDFVNSITC